MNKTNDLACRPDYATSPGEVLHDYLEGVGMDARTFAGRINLDQDTTERLLRGEAPVTPEIAVALESLFGRPAQFWLAMERLYQEDKKRLQSRRGSRKTDPRHRYSISLPGELGRELNARAQAAGVTPYRWIVNELTSRLREKRA